MKNRSLLKYVSVAIVAFFFTVNAHALTLYATYKTGIDVQTINDLSYGYMMDDTIDPPGISYTITEVTPGNFSMTVWLDTTVGRGTHPLGFLSSDGILDDEEVILIIQ